MHVHGPDCGCTIERLTKAVGPLGEGSGDGEGEDPRYQTLWRLVQAARRDWRRWRATLIREVTTALRDGRLLPMTAENHRLLQELLQDHEVAMVIRFAGASAVPDDAMIERLIARGLLTEQAAAGGGYIEPAFRVGRRLETLADAPDDKAVAEILDEAFGINLNRTDIAALESIRIRGAELVKAPARRLTGDVLIQVAETDRALSTVERRAIQEGVAESYVRRETVQQAGRRMRERAVGTRLTNDMDRLVRTELVGAHNFGAKEALRQDVFRTTGELDPWVYKAISPFACVHCQRIWGPAAAPIKYRLSEIEDNDAAGGNYGRKAADWVATTGPIHPNCTCPPLLAWEEGGPERIRDAVQQIMESERGNPRLPGMPRIG